MRQLIATLRLNCTIIYFISLQVIYHRCCTCGLLLCPDRRTSSIPEWLGLCPQCHVQQTSWWSLVLCAEYRHSNSKEDRRWMWQCKRIVSGAMSSCYWTGYQTNYDEPFIFNCPANYVLSGVNSVHSNKREDRRWNFYCCVASGYCTKQCYWSNYINNWDGYMNYRAPHPRVFTGAYSHHSNKRE